MHTTGESVQLAGLKIAAVMTKPPTASHRCAIFIHGGPGGTKDGPSDLFVSLAARLAKREIASIRFDMLGAGESDGDYADMTMANQSEQIAAVIAHARREGCRRIGVVAESLAAASLLLKWPTLAMAAVLLWPAIDLLDTSFKTYLEGPHQAQLRSEGFFLDAGARVGRAFVEELQRLRSLESRLKAVRVPTLLIHGQADSEVPSYQSERAYRLLREPKRLRLVPGAEHGLRQPSEQELVCREVTDWLVRYL
jgi:pimeloyl-ACP methyl ester carboxylesterase